MRGMTTNPIAAWAPPSPCCIRMAPPNPLPPAPIPSFAAPTTWHPDSIVLGQTFTITVNLRNDGLTSDDGRLSVSFPSFAGPSRWAVGKRLGRG